MVVSDSFMEYFRVFFYSLRKHNPWFDSDLVIIHSPKYAPLSNEHQNEIHTLYPKVTFVVGDEERYLKFSPDRRLYAALLKIEAFNLRGYDTVIFLDTDMLCLGDLKYLWNIDAPFAAAPAGKDRESKDKLRNRYRLGQGFNSGVMVINKKYLGGKTYEKILTAKAGPHADQEILNPFFRWKWIYCLDHRYNYNAIFFWEGNETDVKILHYAGEKPLEKPNESRMSIWFKYRAEMGGSPAHHGG
jgi:lipopolysaccharide biosynthesis glycosyltransferase